MDGRGMLVGRGGGKGMGGRGMLVGRGGGKGMGGRGMLVGRWGGRGMRGRGMGRCLIMRQGSLSQLMAVTRGNAWRPAISRHGPLAQSGGFG